MADLTNDQIIEHVEKMSVLDLNKLVKALEEKFGVSAAAAVAAAPAGGGAAAVAAEEKTEFDVILKDAGAEKLKVIKEVRTITQLGLKEAKELVESAGDACKLKEGVKKDEAEGLVAKLKEVGATAVLV